MNLVTLDGLKKQDGSVVLQTWTNQSPLAGANTAWDCGNNCPNWYLGKLTCDNDVWIDESANGLGVRKRSNWIHFKGFKNLRNRRTSDIVNSTENIILSDGRKVEAGTIKHNVHLPNPNIWGNSANVFTSSGVTFVAPDISADNMVNGPKNTTFTSPWTPTTSQSLDYPSDYHESAPTVTGFDTSSTSCSYWSSKTCGAHECYTVDGEATALAGPNVGHRLIRNAQDRNDDFAYVNFYATDQSVKDDLEELLENGESGKGILLEDMYTGQKITVQTHKHLRRSSSRYTSFFFDQDGQINNEEVYAWKGSNYFNPIQLNDIAVDPQDPNLVVGDYYRVHKKYKAIAIIDSCTYNAVECGLERSNLNSKDTNFIGTKR